MCWRASSSSHGLAASATRFVLFSFSAIRGASPLFSASRVEKPVFHQHGGSLGPHLAEACRSCMQGDQRCYVPRVVPVDVKLPGTGGSALLAGRIGARNSIRTTLPRWSPPFHFPFHSSSDDEARTRALALLPVFGQGKELLGPARQSDLLRLSFFSYFVFIVFVKLALSFCLQCPDF